MNNLNRLSTETADAISKETLVSLYNDAVEEIWDLSYRLQQLQEEYDLLMKDYEDLSDQLYG